MIGGSDGLSPNRRLLIGSLLDGRVFDRVGGVVQPVDRPASKPAQPARRRGAVHHEPAGDGRGARVVDRLPHRRHHCRSPDPDRPVRTPRPAHPRRARQAIRKTACSGASSKTSAFTTGRWISCWTAWPTPSPWRNSNMPSPRRGTRHPRSFRSRPRSKTSAGWPNRTISWSFRGKRRRRRWSSFRRPATKATASKTCGMVRFVDDDGAVTYYGTCTAFDGYRVLPQLIETRDFHRVGVHTINGACAEQGHGAFPAADRRALCDVLPHRRRESLHHVFRHRSLLGDGRVAADAPPALGVCADRQLRLAVGNAGRLAAADARRRARCGPTASAPCCWT